MTDYLEQYRGRPVLVTGGLGFIGSNLTRRLVEIGARVSVVDALIPDHGGNRFNVAGLEPNIDLHVNDLRDSAAMSRLASGVDVIFNLAGQVSHIDSMTDPQADLDINCRSHLTLLEACRAVNPRVKVVYASTRQIYGRPDRLPVDESHLVRPTDINGINKAAGEYYHLVYNNVYGVRTCSLRLTNIYGPRQLIRHSRQGFIGWFIRLALEARQIQIFGDGSQLRDFVYVDDAVDAFLRAGVMPACDGGVFNVGGREHIAHTDLVDTLIRAAGSGSKAFVPWPEEKRRIDIGSFYSDSTLFMNTTGWYPAVALDEGLRRTLTYYREHFQEYVPSTEGAVTK